MAALIISMVPGFPVVTFLALDLAADAVVMTKKLETLRRLSFVVGSPSVDVFKATLDACRTEVYPNVSQRFPILWLSYGFLR